ncbi:hypothetical protein ACWEPN_28060 [Nonomuraea wenchangensis]
MTASVGTDEDCPGISPHPAAPRPERTALRWIGQGLAPGRVVAYTCSCRITAYELVARGGVYQIHRVSWTAERRRRQEALEWWRRLLAGQAR